MNINIKKHFNLIKGLFLTLAFIFLFYFIFENKHIIYELLINSDLKLISISILLWLIANCISPLFTKFALSANNSNLKYNLLLAIFLKQLPAKYLPGGIWHTVARYTVYTQHGVKKKQLGYLLAYETVLPVIVAGCVGISVYFKQTIIGQTTGLICIIAILLSCLFSIIGKITSKHLLTQNSLLTLTTFAFWSIASFAFVCYVNSFETVLGPLDNLQTTGAYLIAWATGNLAFFSPQGLGVSEVVASKLLDININFGTSISLIFGFRLIIAIADIISWLIFHTIKKLYPAIKSN